MLSFSTLVADIYLEAERVDIDAFNKVLVNRVLERFQAERVLLAIGDKIHASHDDLLVRSPNNAEWISVRAAGHHCAQLRHAVLQNMRDLSGVAAPLPVEAGRDDLGLGTHYAFSSAPELTNALIAGDLGKQGSERRWLLLYNHRPPGDERETPALLHALWPHLSLAISRNLQRALHRTDLEKAKRTLALALAGGLIETADPEFRTLFQLEWPDKRSFVIPAEALRALLEHGVYQGAFINMTARATGGKLVCQAVSLSVLHRLGDVEKKIALRLAEGMGYREISQQLGTSPNTVRNQISSIYRKLHISSKVSLVTMLAGHQDLAGLPENRASLH